MFRSAPAPTRSSDSFLLSFGLLNIPVSVLTGTEDTQVKRSEFIGVTVTDDLGTNDIEWHEVGRVPYDKATNEVIEDPARIVRRVQDENTGVWVTLSNDEIAACTMPKGVAEIITFVPLDKLHKAYLTTGMAQVRAKTSGMKAAQSSVANKSFALFLAGMKARKVAALIKVSMRGPARFAAITPDGDMLYLQPSDGIRQTKAMDMGMINPTELDLVGKLIDSIGKGTPVLVDDTAAKVREYVSVRAQGMEIGYPVAEASTDVDLFSQLSASIDAAKAGKAGAA